jgi:hypothetical protein
MIRSLAIAVTAVGLVVAPPRLDAQSGIFLDRSYVVHMWPDEGLLYEGKTAIPLTLHHGADSLYATLRSPQPSWSTGTMWYLTPMFVVRQLAANVDASLPVRTPSFMPKLDFQYLAARRIGGSIRQAAADYPLAAMILGFDGTFGHYSNGQAGCFRANEKRTSASSGDCVLDPSAPPGSDTLNTVDGSFSTWYFKVQGNMRYQYYKDSLPFTSFTLSAGVEWHPPFLEPIGGMDSSLAAVYGRIRPFAGAALARRSEWSCPEAIPFGWLPCGRGRVKLDTYVEYLPTHPTNVSSVSTTTELAWTFSRYAGIGPIVRLHTGQDYYNMGLSHELNVLQFGLTVDLERDHPLKP